MSHTAAHAKKSTRCCEKVSKEENSGFNTSIAQSADPTPHNLFQRAQQPDELFATYEMENGNLTFIELKPRKAVHAQGMLHKSVDVFLVRGDKVLLQRRSKYKLIEPLKLDVSTAEHLQYPESFKHAAKRGLKEELGLTTHDLQKIEQFICLRKGTTYNEYSVSNPEDNSQQHIKDFELSKLYVAVFPEHEKLEIKQISEAEVAEVRWVSIDELSKKDDTQFTAWAQTEIPHLLRHFGVE
uniref:Nudix hydrolase domain-containing protein n=1 Tax=Percolomonas cosmopolitus TaxID=63605 RepID=A0A7S1KSP4_9EUKA|mmetsp:Transcript_790/g.2668  ORF Transcript_790/g.2668 Transcript_790/m.2668 type:complete len:240 (+) Transcript_790:3-722(+)